MKRRDKRRIKKLIYHFDNSPKFALYELDEEGKHINLKTRAQRTNYKKLDQEKKQAFNLQKKENYPLEEMVNDQTFSQNHEFFYEVEPSFNFNEIKIEDSVETTIFDQMEQFGSPFTMKQENDDSYMLSCDEPDAIDNFNLGLNDIVLL